METKQAIVLPSGWEAQVCHPFKDGYSEANEVRPLTQYNTPGAKVDITDTFQVNIIDDKWEQIKDTEVQYYQQHGYAVRPAFEVVSEEESKEQVREEATPYTCPANTTACNYPKCSCPKAPNPELSVEEAAETWFDGMDGAGYSRETIFKAGYQQCKIDILQSGEYVLKSDVKMLLSKFRDVLFYASVEDQKKTQSNWKEISIDEFILTTLKNNK